MKAIARPWASLKLCSLGLMFLWLMVDQATKWWILQYAAASGHPIRVAPFLNVTLGWNEGITFGMLGSYQLPPWTLAVLSGCIVTILVVWLLRAHERLVAIGLALLIGGALGNALDRLRHGAVTDFIDFHLAGWHWPAFNMADVGVFCGAALLIIETFIRRDATAD